ncbi:S41 family peptidase [Shouchella lonarensis]|uniref:Peptidase family S41 n=1 Tax=Shouchella lonarensis TaxID=1464122 RepID=A0A1G6HPA6_9BACI|nr:S41 family peptidase [Shouchella lonarensis]SDB95978.1 Peptidase family S41 [Shouchella lonarensis]
MKNIFNDIVTIMHNDYSGHLDKKGCDNPDYFREGIDNLAKHNQLTAETFTSIVQDYLLDFQDKHIFFICSQTKNPTDRGFRVRCYNDKLYVIEATSEKNITIGDAFTSLEGQSISDLRRDHVRLLAPEIHQERENWAPILSLYRSGEYEDEQGNAHSFTFSSYEKTPPTSSYRVEAVPDNIARITMTDFNNPDAIVKMMTDNQKILDSSDNWIIDVRKNAGGSDASFHPLLQYIMPKEGIDLSSIGEEQLFNCTEESAKRIQRDVKQAMEVTKDEQALLFLRAFYSQWDKHKGKGFVKFNWHEEQLPSSFIKGQERPRNIVVLTDTYCGSAGDSFVECCKQSNKVTVIGRPTMGLNDYANLAVKRWNGGFQLYYPTSRLSSINQGKGMTGVGIAPDIYIPWSPEHLKIDVDMDRAMMYIKDTNFSGAQS